MKEDPAAADSIGRCSELGPDSFEGQSEHSDCIWATFQQQLKKLTESAMLKEAELELKANKVNPSKKMLAKS